MNYISGYCTDAGAIKRINQDALCLKSAVYNGAEIILAAVCDGLGGLSDGEAASSYVISALSSWFEQSLYIHMQQKKSILDIRQDLDSMLHGCVKSLNRYSDVTGKKLGTTMTCILYLEKFSRIITAHIGDTRIYRITNDNTEILTADHSIVYNEVKSGLIDEKTADGDPRQNQLTKCIGAGLENVSFDYSINAAEKNAVYLICSDGFRKKITKEEISLHLLPSEITDDMAAETRLRELTDLCLKRNETDNISSVIIKIQEKAEI